MTRDLFLACIGFYQLILRPALRMSPLAPPGCRFEPSCSEYARLAIKRYGAARGARLTVQRLCRCHPFGSCGYDPVPEPSHRFFSQ